MKRFLIVIILFICTAAFAEDNSSNKFSGNVFEEFSENTISKKKLFQWYLMVSQGLMSHTDRLKYEGYRYSFKRKDSLIYSVHFVFNISDDIAISQNTSYNTSKSEGYIGGYKPIDIQSTQIAMHFGFKIPIKAVGSFFSSEDTKIYNLFSPLYIFDIYGTAGNMYIRSDLRLDGKNGFGTNMNNLFYYEFGIRTLEFYHISLDMGYRHTDYAWNNVKLDKSALGIDYRVGGNEWKAGISVVF
ncbi:MAG: hypothetical protein LBH05_05280 [Deferribacteraceae bacterium]|jgi:hypothetical protein|nr:hypothetical protein [Deferribacteraceae bacterium]